MGMRAEVARIVLAAPGTQAERLSTGESDLRAAGRITGPLDVVDGEVIEVRDVELVPVAKPAH